MALQDTISSKDKFILNLQFELKGKEDQFIYRIGELQKLFDEKSGSMKELLDKHERLEKEYTEAVFNVLTL
jgi:hypothetical protein